MWSYVYALTCPITNQVRYIGQSVNPSLRYEQHLYAPGNPGMYGWLGELKSRGLRPGLRIIERCEVDTVSEIEMFWIHHHLALSSNLLNTRYTKSGKVNTEYRRPKTTHKASTPKHTVDNVIRFPSEIDEIRQTVRLPRDLYEKLQALAKKEARSINGQIIASLRAAISKYEREHGPLLNEPENNSE